MNGNSSVKAGPAGIGRSSECDNRMPQQAKQLLLKYEKSNEGRTDVPAGMARVSLHHCHVRDHLSHANQALHSFESDNALVPATG